jgi:hypothetical protein
MTVGYGRPIQLDGMDDRTLEMLAEYVAESPESERMERELRVSFFAQRCGRLGDLRRIVKELEA